MHSRLISVCENTNLNLYHLYYYRGSKNYECFFGQLKTINEFIFNVANDRKIVSESESLKSLMN